MPADCRGAALWDVATATQDAEESKGSALVGLADMSMNWTLIATPGTGSRLKGDVLQS
jgi:hypothetical protein